MLDSILDTPCSEHSNVIGGLTAGVNLASFGLGKLIKKVGDAIWFSVYSIVYGEVPVAASGICESL